MSVITTAEIREIPRRYAMGKRPLSILLGWGELTYTRLIDGNTPSDKHAEELRRIYDDPAAYARILEIGRDRVTDMAYERSFSAVDQLLKDRGGALNATKVYAVADRICSLAQGDITPNALHCLMYYAQGMGFATFDIPLFEELPYAADSGPRYEVIARGYTFDEIQRASKQEVPADSEMLSKQEKKLIDAMYQRYGDSSAQALAKMAREETPWKKARKRASSAEGQDIRETITAKSMKKFFAKK